MSDEVSEDVEPDLQKVFQNVLKFRPGQTVYVYENGARHTFQNVSSLRINASHLLVTIVSAKGNAVFREWSGLYVGVGLPHDFEVGPMPL